METPHKSIFNQKTEEFTRRLDFYGQSLAVYTVVLLVYLFLKGIIVKYSFSMVIKDPVVILLSVFVISTAVALLFNAYKKRTIIIGGDFIILKSRFRQKKYLRTDIIRIAFGKEKIIRLRNSIPIVKIKVKNRRRAIKIRPSSFWNEKKLVHCLAQMKKY